MSVRKNYQREFKLEACKLVVEHGYSVKQAAQQLGVSSKSIHNWIRHFQDQAVLPKSSSEKSIAEELKQLRAQVKRLRLERDILKKAAAYFAKEST